MKSTYVQLLVVFAVIGLLVWLVPPSTPDARAKATAIKPPESGYVTCPTWPPCWRDGRPIIGTDGPVDENFERYLKEQGLWRHLR